MFKNIIAATGMQRLLVSLAFLLFLGAAACTSSGYSSKSGRHKAPASTGNRRCGCSMLNPATRVIDFYQPATYDLQA